MTDPDDSVLVHGDAVVGVLGQLEESLGGGLVDRAVLRLEEADKGGHGPSLPKGHPVIAPHAAAGDGLRQVTTEPVIIL